MAGHVLEQVELTDVHDSAILHLQVHICMAPRGYDVKADRKAEMVDVQCGQLVDVVADAIKPFIESFLDGA